MNSELKELGAEIAEMRRSLESIQYNVTKESKAVREIREYTNSELARIRDEFNAKVKEVEAKKYEAIKKEQDAQLEYDKLKASIEEKNAAYAKLLQAQNETMYYEELSAELAIICEGFEAYFQAHIYQHEDILFTVGAYEKGLNGVLNSNDLGLGKTFESIVTLYILAKKFAADEGRKPRILWLTKKSLVKSTPKEIRMWWPKVKCFTTELSTTPKEKQSLFELFYLAEGDIFLTNYETIRTTTVIAETEWDLIVIDEVHKLKGGANPNGATAIWEAAKKVCNRARFTIMLSGTPMVNRPQEMWSYLHIFSPEKFPSIKQFENHFMDYKSIAGEMQLTVNANKLLQNALKGQMIRRTRDEVGLWMPEFTKEVILLEMNLQQAQIYNSMKDNFFIWLDSMQTKPLTAMAIIAQLTRLRQINVWPAGIKIEDLLTKEVTKVNVEDSSKVDEAMDIILDAQQQVVLFSTFNEPLMEIQRRCIAEKLSCKVINGDSVNKMGTYENDFQQGLIDVLCINSAMGEGLNLQKNPDRWPGGSCIGIFLDLWWSPARNEQCEGRIYRQGASKAVTIYVLQNESSIDGFINSKLNSKDAQFKSILEGDEIRPASDWREFLEGMI